MKAPLFIQLSLFLLLFFNAVNGHSQLYFKAKTITTTDGLSDNRVTCFHKDKRGFMWIGTRNGLNRYDGHSFKVFRPAAGNSISNEVINDIAEDSKGRIWVATMEGLNIYDPVTGNWETMVPDPDGNTDAIPNYIVWDILIDANDLVWIASDVFAFCSFNIRTKKFVYYDWPAFAKVHPNIKQARYHSIQKFVKRNSDEFWLGTTTGLVSLNTVTKNFSFIGAGYYGDVIDLKYDEHDKEVFISVEKGLLFSYNNDGQYQQVLAEPNPYPSTHFVLPGKAEIWVASEMGLLKISDDRKKIRLESNIPQLSGSLLPGGIRSVFEDDKYIRWVATANGVSVYDQAVNSTVFLPLLPVSDKEGVNRMSGVYYDDISKCYFVCALDPACVFIVNSLTGEIKRISTDINDNKLSYCISIKADNSKNLWLLTGNHVYQYNRTNKSFSLFPTPNNGSDIVFRDMLQDIEGNYWFASFNGGLFYYSSSEKKFSAVKDTSLNHLNTATGLATDVSGHMIIGGTFGEGVFTYDLSTGKTSGYYETPQAKSYSQLILVNSIAKDRKGGIWVATHSGGLFRYNPGKAFEKTFTRFDMRSGLSTNNILSICSDADSTIWLLSGKGISAINTNGSFLYDLKEAQTFNFSSFASDSRFSHEIFFSTEKKELLVGVGGGLLLHSFPVTTTLLHFPLAITGVRADGKMLSEQEIGSMSRYRLPFHSNAVAFEFAGLYYGTSNKLVYEYKLEGYDTGWVDARNNFLATYQNLPSGNYLFHVRARDENNNIAAQVSGFPLRIVPPFWRTWWFVLLIVSLSAAALWWFIYSLQQKLQLERAVNIFATSLYGQNTTDDIFWDTAKNCIVKLGFTDCVIYQRDEQREVLIQKAAYGPKNPYRREILNAIEIPIGKGIVGVVAQTGKAIIVKDTSKDSRYIVDDEKRLSEISVPISIDGKVFAVIDSEHAQKKFYTRYHLKALSKIAAICGERVAKHLTEERLRAKIARDLHDEMGSTLTSINIISKVAMEEKPEQEKLKQYFQKIKDHSGRMMESMSDMVWAINPVNDSFDKVLLRMKEFAAEMLEPARINYYFAEEGPLEKTQLNLEQRKDIYMIFKEAVNNIVKYSGATEVNIIIQQNDDKLKMMITDNGNGFDATIVSSGNGLKNMHSRAGEMGATIRIDSIKGTGTSIVLGLTVT